jgi:ribosomal-protein-alanine N-acetyltransferase
VCRLWNVDELIRTERLDLVPMTPEFLEASLVGDRGREEAILGVAIPSAWPDTPHLVRRWLEKLQAEPTLQPWLARAMVLRSERRMIGHAGFHTGPGEHCQDAPEPGSLEFGYTVFESDRRRGYAREACVALMKWAYRQHGLARFVVSISPANVASQELARSLGFERTGSRIDEEDGPEDIFERKLDGESPELFGAV